MSYVFFKKYRDIFLNIILFQIFKFHCIIMETMHDLVDLYRLEQEIQRAKLDKNYNLVLELYSKIIEIKQQFPNRLGLAKTLTEKAYILERHGFHKDALELYRTANNMALGTPNREFLNLIQSKMKELYSLNNFQ